MNNAEYQHMLAKCRDAAAGGWDVQSTGEKLAAALVLNRPDWLEAMGYTIAEAIERVGPEWVSMIPLVAKQIQRD